MLNIYAHLEYAVLWELSYPGLIIDYLTAQLITVK